MSFPEIDIGLELFSLLEQIANGRQSTRPRILVMDFTSVIALACPQ
ncbi:hypothetical protein [Mesorhizobium sp. B2-3-15]|nr:hypothetical protein [Mesorhizobium sp. B2-3-15]